MSFHFLGNIDFSAHVRHGLQQEGVMILRSRLGNIQEENARMQERPALRVNRTVVVMQFITS